MALVKAGDKSVVLASGSGSVTSTKKTQKVLDEETYTEGLEKIIEKDFYPDLPKLTEQSEYFEALETNNLAKLRELQMKYMRNRTDSSTTYSPATFETPEHVDRSPDRLAENTSKKSTNDPKTSQNEEDKDKKSSNLHLDSYLARNTSEDNASFNQILEESQKKHREKHAWLFQNEAGRKEEEAERLALPSMEKQAAIEDTKQAGVDSWKYTIKNSLMYVPEGTDFSDKELIEMMKKKPRAIIHENTRLKVNPWNSHKNKELVKEAASEQAKLNSGKIGHDGKEVNPSDTPRVGGYGFVATPSPVPGVDESPMMTWGEIEGTPFQLDASSTPLTPSHGPAFKMPAVPKRDKLAFDLAEKASKSHRDKKETALKLASRLASPGTKLNITTSDRINTLSPAAQRLIGRKLGIRTNTDKALRASYSPSPTHSTPGTKTPHLLTPNSTPDRRKNTPVRTPGSKHGGSTTPHLTDNLLNIPRKKTKLDDGGGSSRSSDRARATDFF